MPDLSSYNTLVQTKLAQAKHLVKLFAMDYDGTLADGVSYQKEQTLDLIKEILSAGKIPAFSTARAVTAVTNFVPLLTDFYKLNPQSGPTYIAGGNGTVLYKIDATGTKQIYSHGLLLEEVREIVEKWSMYAKENLPLESLSEKGLSTFKKFYSESLEGLVSRNILEIGKKYEGRIFTEEAKVTFVLPKDETTHKKIVGDVQVLIGNKFVAIAGDKDFCHITKRLEDDGKFVAVNYILNLENLQKNQVATFGDMPHGNDKGLLSFPYSFTNNIDFFTDHTSDQPPFLLPGSELDAVGSVYKAVRFLLEN